MPEGYGASAEITVAFQGSKIGERVHRLLPSIYRRIATHARAVTHVTYVNHYGPGVPGWGTMPETHAVAVEEGETVDAVHHRAKESSEGWLFFCHGFRSDKSGSYERRCERATEAGFEAVRFDFRGSGESDRAFVDANLSTRIADLRTVVDHFDPERYALFGSSFGAKVAFHAATDDDRLEAIVGRAPVTYDRAFTAHREEVGESGRIEFEDGDAIDGRLFEDIDRYDFEEAAAAVDVPVALFHGDEDESVAFADSLDAVAALETDVLLQKYRGEGHRFSEAAEARLLEDAFDWLSEV